VTSSLQSEVAEATAAVRARWPRGARLGMVLGTGLSNARELLEIEQEIPYHELPHFPRSTALSHRGQLLCGRLAGVSTIVMDGRCHLYEGYSARTLMLPIHVLGALGVETLVLSNASGGLNPRFRTGDVMVIRDHISCMGLKGVSSPSPSRCDPLVANDPLVAAPFQRGAPTPYDAQWGDLALAIARRENFSAQQGVYVGVSGPNYETRAEYRLFRQIGGDAVGMSTVPEAIAASREGIRVLGLSVITNVARPDTADTVNAEEVIQEAAHSEPHVSRIVVAVAEQLRAG
jgi:purine-nucleoside phosphorylase